MYVSDRVAVSHVSDRFLVREPGPRRPGVHELAYLP